MRLYFSAYNFSLFEVPFQFYLDVVFGSASSFSVSFLFDEDLVGDAFVVCDEVVSYFFS